MKNQKIIHQAMKLIKLLFVLLIAVLFTSFILIQSENESDIEEISEIDAIIVLGAGIWGNQVSPQLELRLKTAYEILNENEQIIAVVSGGQGPDELISEAEAMKKYLIKLGINENRIYIEDQSTSTIENITYSINILKGYKLNSTDIAIVTTDFHMFRAKMLLRRMGIKAEGKSAPNIKSIVVKNNAREVFALIKDFLFSH